LGWRCVLLLTVRICVRAESATRKVQVREEEADVKVAGMEVCVAFYGQIMRACRARHAQSAGA